MTRLENLRGQIDSIDDKIAALFAERMAISKEIALEKNKTNSPIENIQRENELIERITKQIPEDIRIYTRQLYDTIFESSKAYQRLFCNVHPE
jgi:chorismate mutase/prephenate dehydratase